METVDFDTYFMDMLPLIASRSKDPNTKVGTIIVRGNGDYGTCSTGYNSFPRGIKDNVPERLERPEKYFFIEHAERNAIYNAAKNGIPLNGCKIYVPFLPCADCARAIIQVGISEVIYDAKGQEDYEKKATKYIPDFERTRTMLMEAHVRLRGWKRNSNFKPLMEIHV